MAHQFAWSRGLAQPRGYFLSLTSDSIIHRAGPSPTVFLAISVASPGPLLAAKQHLPTPRPDETSYSDFSLWSTSYRLTNFNQAVALASFNGRRREPSSHRHPMYTAPELCTPNTGEFEPALADRADVYALGFVVVDLALGGMIAANGADATKYRLKKALGVGLEEDVLMTALRAMLKEEQRERPSAGEVLRATGRAAGMQTEVVAKAGAVAPKTEEAEGRVIKVEEVGGVTGIPIEAEGVEEVADKAEEMDRAIGTPYMVISQFYAFPSSLHVSTDLGW
ncbi:hypothetical protein B0T18DRAFT_427176 [Schizothecium vesticola]|uniref:Protein kinase domain-containing protein n=1 Tax=Schizothecium vesticola TaxID=314040 RepID=A0AA40K864_9PEZI|nr:hypothetical protein B0T18DRAFT_427176 [Schizothecium vesticola]